MSKPTKEELKAKAYDLMVVIQNAQNQLVQINQAIAGYEEKKEDKK